MTHQPLEVVMVAFVRSENGVVMSFEAGFEAYHVLRGQTEHEMQDERVPETDLGGIVCPEVGRVVVRVAWVSETRTGVGGEVQEEVNVDGVQGAHRGREAQRRHALGTTVSGRRRSCLGRRRKHDRRPVIPWSTTTPSRRIREEFLIMTGRGEFDAVGASRPGLVALCAQRSGQFWAIHADGLTLIFRFLHVRQPVLLLVFLIGCSDCCKMPRKRITEEMGEKAVVTTWHAGWHKRKAGS